jgi:DNA-binding MarR family transcriptional regulator
MRDHEDQPLGFLLYQVTATLRPHVTAELQPLGVGLPEFVCLRNLSMWPAQSNAELARRSNVSPQAMNKVVRDLQDMGAITRPATVPSGRNLPAQLTAKGRALLKRAEAAVRAADERLLAGLTPTERHQLKKLLHAIDPYAVEGAAPPTHRPRKRRAPQPERRGDRA